MKGFFKTVAIVTIFSICEKFLGFLYRIFLSRTIGSEGIGMYQVALSVFALLFTLTCSGTPITVSRLMTKYRAEGKTKKVFSVITAGITFTIATTLPIALFFLCFGKNFSFLFTDERCLKIFLVVMPGLVFTSVYAVLRGVFWGNKDFLPYSVTELLEEICMIVVGIFLINRTTDVYEGAFRAGVAVLISYLFSFTLATITFFIRKNKLVNPLSEFKPLLKSALPITAMRTATSITSSLMSVILPLRLISAGFGNGQALSLFGSAVGQAFPLLTIPTTLIGSFILVLVPEISENYYSGNTLKLKRDVEKALKFSTLLTCLFVPIFLVCGQEIGVLIFNNSFTGKFTSFSAFLMPLMSLSSISTSILNSIGLENKTLLYYIIGGGLMLLCIWFLPSFLGIYALLVGFTCVYGLTTILNLILLNKHCPFRKGQLKFLSTTFLIILPTCFFGILLKNILISPLGILLTLLICSICMAVAMGLLYLTCDLVRLDFFIKPKRKLKTFP